LDWLNNQRKDLKSNNKMISLNKSKLVHQLKECVKHHEIRWSLDNLINLHSIYLMYEQYIDFYSRMFKHGYFK